MPPVAADHVDPVVLAEPAEAEVDPAPERQVDPLAAIRDDLAASPEPGNKTKQRAKGSRIKLPSGPARPPKPPGPLATNAIQVTGYLLGWSTVIVALPYGLGRALWVWAAKNVDLRQVGRDD
jgi:hypothetical protein